jgi:hypothetical protein
VAVTKEFPASALSIGLSEQMFYGSIRVCSPITYRKTLADLIIEKQPRIAPYKIKNRPVTYLK